MKAEPPSVFVVTYQRHLALSTEAAQLSSRPTYLGLSTWVPRLSRFGIARPSCRAGLTMNMWYTRTPSLSNGGINPWRSTAPGSYWIKSLMRSASSTWLMAPMTNCG